MTDQEARAKAELLDEIVDDLIGLRKNRDSPGWDWRDAVLSIIEKLLKKHKVIHYTQIAQENQK